MIQALSGSFFRRELLQFRELENVVNNRRELITAIGRSCYCKNKFVVKTNYNRDARGKYLFSALAVDQGRIF